MVRKVTVSRIGPWALAGVMSAAIAGCSSAPGQNAADYVLQPVAQDEMAVFTPCLERAVDALECLIHRGLSTAMNQFNIREKPLQGEAGG